MNEEDKLIQEQFQKLPASLQKALNTVPWKSSIKEIALLNNLSLEQIAIVERETMFILYGFENPGDYIKNIMREIQIDEEKATTIAEAVNEKILAIITLKVGEFGKQSSMAASSPLPEKAHDNLPMIEKGEVVHDVPHVEQAATSITSVFVPNPVQVKPETKGDANKPKPAAPDARYPGGKDPYREPLV